VRTIKNNTPTREIIVTTLKIKLLGELELGVEIECCAGKYAPPTRARILEAGSGATLTINQLG